MKKTYLRLLLIPFAVLVISWGLSSINTVDFSHYSTEGLELYFDVSEDTELFEEDNTEIFYYPFTGKSYMGFREALGYKESRGNYFVTNQLGYMGKYQFGKSTLHQLGIHDSSSFLKDPILQESAFKAYTASNKWYLRNEIKRYSGKYIGGVLVTESGILAAAHLAGPGNIRKFLRTGGAYTFEDANGASIRYYLRKFSGYDTSHIVGVKNAKAKRTA